jgi:hypothetical protein
MIRLKNMFVEISVIRIENPNLLVGSFATGGWWFRKTLKPYQTNSSLWEPRSSSEEGFVFVKSWKSWFDVPKSCSTNFDISRPNRVSAEVDVSKGVLLQRSIDRYLETTGFEMSNSRFWHPESCGSEFWHLERCGSEFWHLKKQKDFGDHEKQIWHLENSQT